MATTQPTPQRSNPTTESEETNQEPVHPRLKQANTKSTTNETTTDLPTQSSQGIGIVIIIIIVMVSTVILVIITAILLKKCHNAASTATNRAYGLNTHKGREESIYMYKYKGSERNVDNTKQNVTYIITNTVEMNELRGTRIVTEGNKAYATSITTEGNQAYTSSIATDRGNQAYTSSIATGRGNQAYTSSIATDRGNQAYTSSIATGRNAAYGQVTSDNVYEVID